MVERQELTLRPYQEEDVQFILRRRGRAYIGSEPGTGKTAESLAAFYRLTRGEGKALIVGTQNSLGTWEYEAQKWFGIPSVIYTGEKKKRNKLWEQFTQMKSGLLIMNYVMFREVSQFEYHWSMIICDEIHKGGILNPTTQTFKALDKLSSEGLILITGTPVTRGPQDLWGPLHLLDRKRFPAYWPFVNKYCIVNNDMFGKTIEGRPKDVKLFNKTIFEYMIRRKKKDVILELPDKIRQPLFLHLEGKQKEMYHTLMETMMLEIDEENVLITPNAAVLLLRLRQLLVCPRLLGIDDDGIGLTTLKEQVQEQIEIGKSVAICTPFRQAVPYLVEAMKLITPNVFQIHGQIKTTAKQVSLEFQGLRTTRKIIIYTIKSGMSWDAYDAEVLYFLGYEWGAYDNLQAEDRLHRIGQTKSVHINYLLHKDTVDEAVMDRLDEKQLSENWILTPQKVLDKLNRIKSARGQ